jgi:DNA polymerase III epsilon subunit family exonuclease
MSKPPAQSSPWKTIRFVAFDLETTGTDRTVDRITEVGFVTFEDGEVVDRYQHLVNPQMEIPAEVEEITGITNADVADAPTFEQLLPELQGFFEEDYLLAFNANFDLPFLRAELEHIGESRTLPACFDPFPFCWKYLRRAGHTRDAKLTTICEYLSIPLENAHRADHDAEAAGHVFLRMDEFAELPTDADQLLSLQHALSDEVESLFGKRRTVFSSIADVRVELGGGYIYGDESDPLRYLFKRLPDVRDVDRS